jgi:hypothetical protein
MVTEVTPLPPEVAAKILPVELEARLTVVVLATFFAFPKLSWDWTVIGPSVAFADAAPDTAEVVMANLVAVPTVMVTVGFPAVRLVRVPPLPSFDFVRNVAEPGVVGAVTPA